MVEARHNDWWRRAVRTLLQLLAGGAFTALFDQVATDVPAAYTPYVVIASTLLVTTAQNYLEDAGKIPALLKAEPSAGDNPVPR